MWSSSSQKRIISNESITWSEIYTEEKYLSSRDPTEQNNPIIKASLLSIFVRTIFAAKYTNIINMHAE